MTTATITTTFPDWCKATMVRPCRVCRAWTAATKTATAQNVSPPYALRQPQCACILKHKARHSCRQSRQSQSRRSSISTSIKIVSHAPFARVVNMARCLRESSQRLICRARVALDYRMLSLSSRAFIRRSAILPSPRRSRGQANSHRSRIATSSAYRF